jgi:hypothetical protein
MIVPGCRNGLRPGPGPRPSKLQSNLPILAPNRRLSTDLRVQLGKLGLGTQVLLCGFFVLLWAIWDGGRLANVVCRLLLLKTASETGGLGRGSSVST